MPIRINRLLAALFITLLALTAAPARGLAAQDDTLARDTLHTWYRLILELVRHTPTYSPPVASRSFAYLGVTAYRGRSQAERATCRPSRASSTAWRRCRLASPARPMTMPW